MATKTSNNARLYLFGAALLLWGGLICVRLVYLQIFCYGEFEQRAQHEQQRTLEVAARRGIIYDRSGHELAMSVSVDSAFAVPSEIPDLASTLSLISRITKDDPRDLLAQCEGHKTFCWVARMADPDTASRIKALNLRGIHFLKESKRFYPKGELAAQVIGYVGTDGKGLSGIEREFNDEMKGEPGRMVISVDAHKKWFSSVEKEPVPGKNIVLTIDQQIQYIAERELDTAMRQTHAETGTVVVENPGTGEILALANSPSFNLDDPHGITPKKLINHAVSNAYEPGSTFKLVTIAAALQEKLTRPDEMVDCQMGSILFNGMRIRDSKPHGVLSVADVLAESSDVGAIKVGMRLGDDRFYRYIRDFGFGQQTGVELPHETRGLSATPIHWSKVSIAAISMGQEIGITPLQLVALISTMANDGVRVPPRIVAATTEPQSTPQLIAFHPAEQRRVISPLVAAEMRQMMQGVVLHGTGEKALLEGYSSAGKTGTAQKVDPDTKAYSRTKYVATFAGFAPVNNPAITVAVILDSAAGLHQGGQICAPVFRRIAQQVLEYLHVPHDVELPESRRLLLAERKVKEEDLAEGSPDHLGQTLDTDADADSQDSPPDSIPAQPAHDAADSIEPAALREQEPAAQNPKPAAARSKQEPAASARPPGNGTVVLDVEQGGIVVPSFVGKTVRSAVELAEQNSLDVDAIGSGIAREQSPPSGSHVAAGSTVTVTFGR